MGAFRLDGPPRHARPLALASAVVTLLGALALCLGLLGAPAAARDHHGAPHDRWTAAAQAAVRAEMAAAPGTPGALGAPGAPGAFGTPGPLGRTVPAFRGEPRYSCPYEPGGCSLFPALSPVVLGAPPHDAPPHLAGRLPQLTAPHLTGRVSRSGAQPRAPDLHVLQVLRT
ncbi:hypothetical protein SLA_1826 [Streptomyces laurentii]|uniref:Uncharacterized protein n=1 Tax=Streptomyces laurentii TaxID=39478 RepID=A0A160NX93_STRLU|nr:hypothetical protein SLA_1826 [Streptomyces laurentii]